jgi:hypothetical protein
MANRSFHHDADDMLMEVYNEGHQARWQNRGLHHNPYVGTCSYEEAAWSSGWLAADTEQAHHIATEYTVQ